MLDLSDSAVQRALTGAVLASISSAPLGVFLVLRRMSLMGDVMAHAILPGVAVAFMLCGMSLMAMTIGGLVVGVIVALLAGYITRVTDLREDASLAAFYLIAVAAGVMMLSLGGDEHEMEEILFGSVEALDLPTLGVMAGVCLLTLGLLAASLRALVVESFDPVFLRSVGGKGGLVQAVFIFLCVLNMVINYRAMGTLMSAGLMLVPAIAAQFWTQRLRSMILLSVGFALISAVVGLALAMSHHVPSGPAIILSIGAIYIVSLLVGRFGSVRARYFPFRHLAR